MIYLGQIVQMLLDLKDDCSILLQNVCIYLPVNAAMRISYLVILNAVYTHGTVFYCQGTIFIWYTTLISCATSCAVNTMRIL